MGEPPWRRLGEIVVEEIVDLDRARTLLEEVPRRHQAVPLLRAGEELTVILADPTDRQAVAELEVGAGARVQVALARGRPWPGCWTGPFPRPRAPAGPVRRDPAGLRALDLPLPEAAEAVVHVQPRGARLSPS